MKKSFLFILFLLVSALGVIGGAGVASAHASLERADPPPNAHLATAPEALHLWFTEPVEPTFSRIEVRGGDGNLVAMSAPSGVHEDGYQLAQPLPDLPDGVYTIAWRVVSATDGHATQGSYPISIGAAVIPVGAASGVAQDQPIPAESAIIRWLNLISLALFGGLPVFIVLVTPPRETATRSLWTLTWVAWIAVGVTSVLVLLLQVSILSGAGVTLESILSTLFDTRYGTLWLIRIVVWMVYGAALMFLRPAPYRLLAVLAGAALLTQSLFSHASGAESNVALYIAADWLHLAAMSAWIGGLVALLTVIAHFRRQSEALGGVVARFSNLARVAVILLILTGVVSSLQQVGTLEALTGTTYGAALILKLLLFLPLIAIAAVNLLVTSRGLRTGQEIWTGRLRLLTGVEIALAVAIMAAVGVMTAVVPARIADASRAVAAPPDTSFFEMQIESGVMVHLSISPGTVGENQFEVDLYDEATGEPIDDASLIRLRFESTSQDIGESELRPTLLGDGRYSISGSNLSLPGDWRIRVSIQRPGQYDTVVDFAPHIPSADEIAAMAAANVVALQPAVASGVGTFPTPVPRFDDATPVHLVVTRDTSVPPWLITQGGTLLQPEGDGAGKWIPVAFDAHVNNAYFGLGDVLWAATESGLFMRRSDGAWQQLGTFSVTHLDSMHGFLFAFGTGGILRVSEGGLEGVAQDVRSLTLPLAGAPAQNFAMLGNHEHILLNGSQVFLTPDMGLSWEAIDAPDDVVQIGVDGDANLLAVMPDTVEIWDYAAKSWRERAPIPFGAAVEEVVHFNRSDYVLSEGQIYVLSGDRWNPVSIADDLTIEVSDIAFQYPDTLWALDSANSRLYHSTNAITWDALPIQR